jgi:protein SCO1/2
MNQPGRKTEWAVWGALLLTTLIIVALFVRSQLERRYLIDLRPIAQIPDFDLVNQDGRKFSLADLRGNVWVGDIIFTRCGGPCPTMTKQMRGLQDILPADKPVKLVTLTTDPEFDRPEILKRYGEKAGFDAARWNFLTGNKEQIARVAVDGMKLTAMEKSPSERGNERDLFIHSTLFVLVDKRGRLRGAVESDDPEMARKVSLAVKRLLKEK